MGELFVFHFAIGKFTKDLSDLKRLNTHPSLLDCLFAICYRIVSELR